MEQEFINNISIQSHNNSDFERGKAQWAWLHKVISIYSKEDISSVTSSPFEATTWELEGEAYNLHFEELIPSESYLPLQTILKILLVLTVKFHGTSPGYARTCIMEIISKIVPTLEVDNNPLLKAKPGSPFTSFEELSPNDISLALTFIYQSYGTLSRGAITALDWIEKFQYNEHLALVCGGFITPWTNEGVSLHAWYDNHAEILTDVVRTKKPFAALTDQAVSNIVKKAMPFFDGLTVSTEGGIEMVDKDFEAHGLKIMKYIRDFSVRKGDLDTYTLTRQIGEDITFKKLLKEHSELLKSHPILKRHIFKDDNTKDRIWLKVNWFKELFELARNAAIWILALTTGLRNSDLRYLKADCLHYSEHYRIWFIRADLKKTKNTILIPIGEPTVKALKLLNWLRLDKDEDSLLQIKVYAHRGKASSHKTLRINKGNTLNSYLKKFASTIGIKLDTISDNDDEATCHCIRATLAGYVGRSSTLAILILKKLFGHSNNLMPEQYIMHNRFVQEERKKQILEMQSQTAHNIAKAIADGEISGSKGEELLKGAAYLESEIRTEMIKELGLTNNSLTEADVHKRLVDTLTQLIFDDMQNEQTHTLLTPMGVICMRATNHSNDSPCTAISNKLERDKAGVSRAMFGALPQLPNPAQCIGASCNDALLTKQYSMPLLKQFDWYTNVYRKITGDVNNIDEDAKHFVETYYPVIAESEALNDSKQFKENYGGLLKQLYASEREQGYFDV